MIHRIEIGGFVAYCGDNFLKLLNQKVLEYIKEHNTDTSARHSKENDDIVRTVSNIEDTDLQNKESVR